MLRFRSAHLHHAGPTRRRRANIPSIALKKRELASVGICPQGVSARRRLIDQLTRPRDFAELPTDMRQVSSRGNSRVEGMTALSGAVPVRIVNPDGFLEMHASVRQSARMKVYKAGQAVRGDNVWQLTFGD